MKAGRVFDTVIAPCSRIKIGSSQNNIFFLAGVWCLIKNLRSEALVSWCFFLPLLNFRLVFDLRAVIRILERQNTAVSKLSVRPRTLHNTASHILQHASYPYVLAVILCSARATIKRISTTTQLSAVYWYIFLVSTPVDKKSVQNVQLARVLFFTRITLLWAGSYDSVPKTSNSMINF